MEVATQILYVFRSDVPKKMKIYNPYVRILEMKNSHQLENLVLCAPNLECFEYRASRGQRCTMDISACLCLTVLILKEATVTDKWVKTTISGLGCLEDLQIISCHTLEKIEFKNDRLETLALSGCSKLKEAVVDAGNLIEFSYSGSIQVYPMLFLSAKCSANITLHHRKSDLWFANLKRFLSCFDHFKVLAISCISAKDLIFPRVFVLRNWLCPLHDVKHLTVKVRDVPRGRTVTQLLESLLWLIPKPEKLTLDSAFTTRRSSLKFEYCEKVEKMEVEESCYCGIPIKCWRHYGIKIELEGFDANGRENLEKFSAPYNWMIFT